MLTQLKLTKVLIILSQNYGLLSYKKAGDK